MSEFALRKKIKLNDETQTDTHTHIRKNAHSTELFRHIWCVFCCLRLCLCRSIRSCDRSIFECCNKTWCGEHAYMRVCHCVCVCAYGNFTQWNENVFVFNIWSKHNDIDDDCVVFLLRKFDRTSYASMNELLLLLPLRGVTVKRSSIHIENFLRFFSNCLCVCFSVKVFGTRQPPTSKRSHGARTVHARLTFRKKISCQCAYAPPKQWQNGKKYIIFFEKFSRWPRSSARHGGESSY